MKSEIEEFRGSSGGINNKPATVGLSYSLPSKKRKSKDKFGFHTDFTRQFNKSNQINPFKNINYTKMFLIAFSIFAIVIFLLVTGSSGYIAWNSFTNDPRWLKATKTGLAVMFAPAYLFYIFLKAVIFKIPN